MERDTVFCYEGGDYCNFNSHAHVERDCKRILSQVQIYISTHTLTWSVTRATNGNRTVNRISTHTLTWSVTFADEELKKITTYFNSHAHVERDGIVSVRKM